MNPVAGTGTIENAEMRDRKDSE